MLPRVASLKDCGHAEKKSAADASTHRSAARTPLERESLPRFGMLTRSFTHWRMAAREDEAGAGSVMTPNALGVSGGSAGQLSSSDGGEDSAGDGAVDAGSARKGLSCIFNAKLFGVGVVLTEGGATETLPRGIGSGAALESWSGVCSIIEMS